MSGYTWDTYPAHGTSNFEVVARAALETWRTNGSSMEVRLNELEDGTYFSGVNNLIPSSALVSVEADKIGDGSLPVDKLDVDGTTADGTTIVYRTASGWGKESIEGIVGKDTYQVRYSESGGTGFLESFVATSEEALLGTAEKLLTAEMAKVSTVARSVNNMSDVYGTITITPAHKTYTFNVIGPTTIEFVGMDEASIEYMIDLQITNPSGYSITWPTAIEWEGGSAPSIVTVTRLSIGTNTGGASYFGALTWSSKGSTGTYVECAGDDPLPYSVVADGSEVSRSAYANLFAKIGTRYGEGDGSTTFNLPNRCGLFSRGADLGANVDPDAATRTDKDGNIIGDVVGSLQTSANLAHTHPSSGNHSHYTLRRSVTVQSGSGTGVYSAGEGSIYTYTNNAGSHTHGSSGGVESRPTNIAVLVCIYY